MLIHTKLIALITTPVLEKTILTLVRFLDGLRQPHRSNTLYYRSEIFLKLGNPSDYIVPGSPPQLSFSVKTLIKTQGM